MKTEMSQRAFTFRSLSEDDTDRLGAAIAAALESGLVIALQGSLGAGKTRLSRAICSGLGIDPGQVTSPTFVLMQFYGGGRFPVVHFDTYRLGDLSEFISLGAEEYLENVDCVALVEWADRVLPALPNDRLTIECEHDSESARTITLTADGLNGRQVIDRVQRILVAN
jgi:tRNA threonylcarbamoyladenosine biosynthesis protein TsaE